MYAGSPEYLSLRCAQRYSGEVWRVSGDESEPRLVAVSARVDRLTHELFVADAANSCIKWFDHRDDTLKQVYRAERGARVHNALLPDASRLDLFAIDSLDNSGLNKAETRFRLLRLRWTLIKDEEEEVMETWELKWAEEFYRVESEQLDANAQHTSLCRAGGHVLCSVALSNRLVAFEYQMEKEEKKKEEEEGRKRKERRKEEEKKGEAVGDQLFERDILSVDSLNSGTGSLIAIAFVNGIRLYRHTSVQSEFASFNLQETFYVNRENVHKLLFAGARLLVAVRSQDEKDRVWSMSIVGEKLDAAERVEHELQFSMLSWCIGPYGNTFYCVDSVLNDLLKFE